VTSISRLLLPCDDLQGEERQECIRAVNGAIALIAKEPDERLTEDAIQVKREHNAFISAIRQRAEAFIAGGSQREDRRPFNNPPRQ
jgi:hypothetical protein